MTVAGGLINHRSAKFKTRGVVRGGHECMPPVVIGKFFLAMFSLCWFQYWCFVFLFVLVYNHICLQLLQRRSEGVRIFCAGSTGRHLVGAEGVGRNCSPGAKAREGPVYGRYMAEPLIGGSRRSPLKLKGYQHWNVQTKRHFCLSGSFGNLRKPL